MYVKKTILAVLVMLIIITGVFPAMLLGEAQASSGGEVSYAPYPASSIQRSETVNITGVFVINQTTIDPLTGERGKYGFDANVVVTSTGTLRVENATIYFLSDENHHYTLTVKGNLYLYNATVTIGKGLILPHYPFSINIQGPGWGKVEIINSKLLYPGWFNVTNKGGNVVILNSTFGKMSGGPLDNPPSYGPIPYLYNSKVFISHSQFRDLPKRPSSGSGPIGWVYNDTVIHLPPTGGFGAARNIRSDQNVTLANFKRVMFLEYVNFWKYVILKDINVVFSYSNDTDYDQSALMQIIYVGKYKDTYLANFTIPGSNKPTGWINQTISLENYNFTGNDFFAALQNGKIIVRLISPEKGNLTINGVTILLNVEKNLLVDGIEGYSFNVVHSTIFLKDTYVDVDYRHRRYLGTTHNMFNVMGDSRLYFLNLTINDTGTQKREDTSFLFQDNSSEAYILRYVVADVTFHHHPIDGLKVYATPYPVDSADNSQIVSRIVNIISTYITETKNVDGMSFGHITGNTIWDTTVNGIAKLPLLSDILNNSEMPNSKFVGIYNLEVKNDTKQFASVQIGLNYFPWLLESNNTVLYNLPLSKYKDVDLTVEEIKILNEKPYVTGEDVSLTVKVANLGKDSAEAPSLSIWINNVMYTNITLPDMGGSSEYTQSFTLPGSYFATPNEYVIKARVYHLWDYNGANNEKSVAISVGDLYAKNWAPSEVVRYHSTNVTWKIYSTYPWSNVKVSLYLDNESNLLTEYTTDLKSGDNSFVYSWDVGSLSQGQHTFILYVNAKKVGTFTFTVVADVDLSVSSLSVSPSEIYVEESVDITANVVNLGKDTPSSATIYISIYDPSGNLILQKSFTYPSSYSVTFTPQMAGTYTVQVKVYSSEDINTNNDAYTSNFSVNPVPYDITIQSENEYINGTDIVVNVTIYSVITAQVNAQLYVVELGILLEPVGGNPVSVKADSSSTIKFILPAEKYAPLLKGRTSAKLTFYVNVTSNRTGDAQYSFGPKQIYIQEIADLTVVSGTLEVQLNGNKVDKVAEGVKVTITFVAKNVGGLPANLTYLIMDNEKVLEKKSIGILNPGDSVVIEYNYTIAGIGSHTIKVALNPDRNVTENNYNNNNASYSLNVIPPDMQIVFSKYSKEHNKVIYQDDHLVVIVKVINKNATESLGRTVYMRNVTVSLNLGDLGRYTAVTSEYGVAIFQIPVKKVGEYTPIVTLQYHGAKKNFVLTAEEYKVVVEKKPLQLPWLWIIVAAIAAGVGGFFLYGFLHFKKKAKEYMICGNCGRLVPADAERCPYCGVVFEKEKVKCPECGSWIDEDSKYCPVCGTIFMDKSDPEYEKYSEMKTKYERYLEKYKTEAKKYIGEEFTTEEFFKWWKTHPEFISFQEWLKRQEERIEGETVICPVCGAVNPKGAKICRVCGSPLPQEKEEKEEKKEEVAEAEAAPEEEKPKEGALLKPEEYERLKRPGVITVEEWAKRKGKVPEEEEKKEKEEKEEKPPEEKPPEKEKKPAERKPVVKKKVIKKVIALEEEEKKREES